MKNTILLLVAFAVISCKKQQSVDEENNNYRLELNKKITPNKPFFDFDEVTHYQISISEKDFLDLVHVDSVSEEGKLLSCLLEDPCPITQEEKVKFEEAIKSVDKQENVINPKYYNELRNKIFTEKKCKESWAYACAPLYRDIFIFKKNNVETGMAKICFECQLFSFSNEEAVTDCFNMNGELGRLKKIILENKKKN